MACSIFGTTSTICMQISTTRTTLYFFSCGKQGTEQFDSPKSQREGSYSTTATIDSRTINTSCFCAQCTISASSTACIKFSWSFSGIPWGTKGDVSLFVMASLISSAWCSSTFTASKVHSLARTVDICTDSVTNSPGIWWQLTARCLVSTTLFFSFIKLLSVQNVSSSDRNVISTAFS